MRAGPFNDDTRPDELEQVIVMAKVVDPVERKGGMRLNAQMKNEVLEKAMKHGFDKRKDAIQKESLQLCRLFYNKVFGLAALKHAKALKGTPFIRIDHDQYGRKVDKKENRQHTRWNVGGQVLDLPVPDDYPLDVTHSTAKFVVKDEALIERCRALQSDMEKLNNDYQRTAATLTGMLSRITTYPSLEKNWPAGVKFYQHLPKAYPFRHQVPAVMIDELNAALGVG